MSDKEVFSLWAVAERIPDAPALADKRVAFSYVWHVVNGRVHSPRIFISREAAEAYTMAMGMEGRELFVIELIQDDDLENKLLSIIQDDRQRAD